MKKTRLSYPQRRMLRDAYWGNINASLSGKNRSFHGGAVQTRASLIRLGLLSTRDEVTKLGAFALECNLCNRVHGNPITGCVLR